MDFFAGQDSWTATPEPAPAPTNWPAQPFVPDITWRPLRQHWAAGQTANGFQPGWARVQWNSRGLVYDAVLFGSTFRNSARRLNELTWELGDVCEIFVQAEDAPHYLEIHITPENQRLQLRFPHDGIAAVRSGRARLADFMVEVPDWVQTRTHQSAGQLHVQAFIPAAILGRSGQKLGPTSILHTAVCRYDYSVSADAPILSSTAPLSEPSFHQREEWTQLRLAPSAGGFPD